MAKTRKQKRALTDIIDLPNGQRVLQTTDWPLPERLWHTSGTPKTHSKIMVELEDGRMRLAEVGYFGLWRDVISTHVQSEPVLERVVRWRRWSPSP